MSVQDYEYARNTSREKVVGDEGLKAYIRKVFNYMMISLGLTTIVSYIMLRAEFVQYLISDVGYTGLGWAVVFSPLAIMLFMGFNRNNMSAEATKICLYLVSAVEGASVSLLLYFVNIHTVYQAFLTTGILFGAMSLYGSLTNRNLLGWGRLLFMGLLGIIIASIVGSFFGGFGIWLSYLTVLVFTGLVAYDTQKIKALYSQVGGYNEFADKMAAYCALELYLDFLNIFMSLIQIFSDNRR